MREHLFLKDEDWKIFSSILDKYNCTVYAYGSRIKGTHKKFSDIDLCIVENIPIYGMMFDFEDSDLPMKVDVHRRKEFSTDFFNLIKDDLLLLKSKTKDNKNDH